VISRSEAERLIAEALRDPPLTAARAERCAASLVDRIYGVPGADAINPRYGTAHYSEYKAFANGDQS
jgi:hypothetical protein